MREDVISQYEKIAERAHYKDPRLFEVHFIVERQVAALTLLKFLEGDLVDFFKCSKVVIVTNSDEEPEMKYTPLSSFKHRGKYQDAKLDFYIKIYKTSQHKCVRCFKYVNEAENQICGNCQGFLPKEAELPGAEPSQPQLP